MPAGLKPGQKALVGAGRKKGTPNKNTRALQELIAEACGSDYDPVVGMARVDKFGTMPVYDPQTLLQTGVVLVTQELRQKCAKEVAEYIHAKRKSIDLQTPPGEELNIRLSGDVKALETLQGMLTQLGDE